MNVTDESGNGGTVLLEAYQGAAQIDYPQPSPVVSPTPVSVTAISR